MKHNYGSIMIFILTLYLFVVTLGLTERLNHIQRDLHELMAVQMIKPCHSGRASVKDPCIEEP